MTATRARSKKRVTLAEREFIDEVILEIPGFDPHRLAEGFRLDYSKAAKVLRFFPACLRHVKGDMAGDPFTLERWQSAILANLFGWVDSNGLRRFREAMIYVPKKNGKTAFAAGIVLYMMTQDGELGSEIYSAASSRDQAALLFQHVIGMIRQKEDIFSDLRVYGGRGGTQQRSVVNEKAMGFYRCLAAGADTADGANVHCAVIDELHRHKTPELCEVLEKSTAARKEPLILYTTTADYQRESVCNTKRDYAGKVRDGVVDDARFLPVIYGLSTSDDYADRDLWRAANPNLGVTFGIDFLERQFQKAEAIPSELGNFLRLHLNVVTESVTSWIDIGRWDDCVDDFDRGDLRGEPCYGGLDLGGTRDFSALVLFFPGAKRVLPFFWVPAAAAVEREKRDRVPYMAWSRGGYMDYTDGVATDFSAIRIAINELSKEFDIRDIGFDPWSARQLAGELLNGDHIDMVEFRQGFGSMNEPTNKLERMILSKEIHHDGNKVLRWMVSNAIVVTDTGGNVKVDKQRSIEKVDGVVAMIMAIGRWMAAGDNVTTSVYEKRGMIII